MRAVLLALVFASLSASAHNSSRGVSRFVVDERGQVAVSIQLSEQDIVDLLFIDLSDPQQARAVKGGALDKRLEKNLARWLKLKMSTDGSFTPCPLVYGGIEEIKLRTYVVKARAHCPQLGNKLRLDWGLSSSGTSLKLTHIGSVEGPSGIKHAVVLSKRQNSHVLTVRPPPLWKVFVDFLWLGLEHIALGWDHLLFVLAILLTCRKLKRVFVVVSAFTVAHSLTLALGATDVVRVSSSIVEPLIALSIALSALMSMVALARGKLSFPGSDLDDRGLVVALSTCFVVGLVHGLGFAAMLVETLEVGTKVVVPLIAFNVGVELGQMFAVALVFPLLALAFKRFGRAPVFAILGSLIVVGVVVALLRVLETS